MSAPRCGHRCDRGALRENRSQLVFTTARGRDAVFWQSPRTRKQARPNVRTPTARAHGITELHILIDAHEQYPYRFATQQASTAARALPCGDYGLLVDGRLVASVERKSLADLVTSLTSGKLRYQVADLATLPRAAVVVEDRYSQLFKLDRVRPAVVADGLAELQIRWPNVAIVFCETRPLAEEFTYRFLAAAHAWAVTEHAALQPYLTNQQRRHRTRSVTRRAGTHHRRGPRLGPRRRPAGARPRPAAPRHLAGMARRQRPELTAQVHPRTTLAHQIGQQNPGSHKTRCARNPGRFSPAAWLVWATVIGKRRLMLGYVYPAAAAPAFFDFW